MKMKHLKTTLLIAATTLLVYSCKKQSSSNPSDTVTPLHTYGLNAMTADQWSFVPTFSEDVVSNAAARTTGLSATTLPTSFLLSTPPVRDQGQIGCCTGFCGSECNEILRYYSGTTSPVTSTSLDSAHGLVQAAATQFTPAAVLSPLFLYYVERCVLNGQAITADGGAAMVNIPEVLQGLSNNSGRGTTLTKRIGSTTYTFSGESTEALYAYPSTGSNTSAAYTTAPTAAAIAAAPTYKIAAQSGTTGSAGTTAHGYYVINSTNRVNDVKVALANKKPVMMGFNVYDNSSYQYFEGLGMTGYAPGKYTYNPLTSTGTLVSGLSLLGGHAVPIVGYIDDATKPGGGLFIVENSWNTYWGYHGYFYMPYSVLASTTIVPAGNLYVSII